MASPRPMIGWPTVRIEGARVFEEPRQAVFDALTDPHVMAEAVPGVERVEIQNETHWTARIKVPLGVGSLSFQFELLERQPPEHARLIARGKALGAGMLMDTEFELGEDRGRTDMRWRADVRLSGLLGRLGQPVVRPVAEHMVGGILDAVGRRAAR